MTSKHILVVEDERHLAMGIKYNLEAEGYRVTTVGDGPSALKLIAEAPGGVDLVILDLMLPGMSGYAVCEALRADENHMPVMILAHPLGRPHPRVRRRRRSIPHQALRS